mgnify:CR=1 FL=1
MQTKFEFGNKPNLTSLVRSLPVIKIDYRYARNYTGNYARNYRNYGRNYR